MTMKQLIKFRGKRTDTGELVFGDLIHGVGSKHGRIYILPVTHIYPKGCNELDGWEVIPETVGQFTGFIDTEGADVYEDDIVFVELRSWHTGKIIVSKMCKVGFDKGCFGLCGYGHNGAFERFCNFVESLVSFKIVGNSHDNPELLKGGKE